MISKFAKSPCPSRYELKKLYDSGLTQRQIGERYDVCYQTVVSWMKKLKIKSRGYSHIIKYGKDNPQWKGDKASYAALHYRVSNLKGRPAKCQICGTRNANKTYEWACVGSYLNMDDYIRMCRSCHHKHDKSHLSNHNVRKEFDRIVKVGDIENKISYE